MAKPRKWSNLEGQLPEPAVELTPWELSIREVLRKLDALQLPQLQEEWSKLDAIEMQDKAPALEHVQQTELKDLDRSSRKMRNLLYAALDRRVLTELRKIKELAGTDQYKGALGTFSPKHNVDPSITDNAALTKWAKDNGFEELLALPKSKLSEIITDALDQNAASSLSPAQRAGLTPGSAGSMQPPPGVKLYMRTTVSFRGKGKPAVDDE